MNKIHRYISFYLCLALILFCLSPIHAHALVDPAYSSAYIVVGDIVVEGISQGAKLIASTLASVWNKVFTPELLQTCQGVLEIGSFFTSPVNHKAVFDSYSEGELSSGQVVLTQAFISSVAAAYKTKTGQTLSVADDDVIIYVPPESVWTEAELITAYRLNVQGFSDLTEVNKNILAGNQITWQLKEDFNSLASYLRTTFVDTLGTQFDDLSSSLRSTIGSMNSNLASKLTTLNTSLGSLETSIDSMGDTLSGDLVDLYALYSSLGQSIIDKLTTLNSNLGSKLTTLNTSLGSIETSIDVMEDSLSDDLVDLKSLYSSFGNATLDKLDTLNTSIQDIELSLDTSSLSKDFSDLKTLYSEFGNATIAELESIYDLNDDWFGVLNETFLNEFQVLSGQLTDLNSSISDLDTNIGISLGNVQGAITALEGTLADFSGVNIDTSFSDLSKFVEGELYAGITDTNFSLTDINETLSDLLLDSFDQRDALADIGASINLTFESIEALNGNLKTHFDALNTNLTDYFTSINDLYLNDYLDVFSTGVTSMADSFDQLLSDTSNLVEVKVSLEELVGNDLLDSNTFTEITGIFQSGITSELQNIKTHIQSITDSISAEFIPDTSVMDVADALTAPLFPTINNGFGMVGDYFGSIEDFLGDDLNGFIVVGMIFEEFADMSFFYKLIIISCSIGLIGTLLGMSLNVASYSVAQRRREEAAQARAHDRMASRRVDLYVHV